MESSSVPASSSSASLFPYIKHLGHLFPCRDGVTTVTRISSGTFGQVYKVGCVNLRRELAVKISSIVGRPQLEGTAIAEVQVLQYVAGHPHCLHLLYAKIEQERVSLVLELAAGSWDGLVKELAASPRPQRINIAERHFRQAINGLAFLHRLRIVHRDIKPDNIMVRGGNVRLADGTAVIGDFGYAGSTGLGFTSSLTIFASPIRMAKVADLPDVAREIPHLADTYSFGVSALVLISVWHDFIGASSSFPPPHTFSGPERKEFALHRLPIVEKWLKERGAEIPDTAIARAIRWDQAKRPSSVVLMERFPSAPAAKLPFPPVSTLAARQEKVSALYEYAIDDVKGMGWVGGKFCPLNPMDFLVEEIRM